LQTAINSISLSVFQTSLTSNRSAVRLTVFKIASGESAFLFMQTASTFCQSAACLTVSKIVSVKNPFCLFHQLQPFGKAQIAFLDVKLFPRQDGGITQESLRKTRQH
jgi:hypothetical protein